MTDYLSDYVRYTGVLDDDNEAPITYHRWTAISMISTLLGRNAWIPFGHSIVYPNQYILLMGAPGTRKSSAIGIAKSLLKQTGYTRFSGDKTSKERFLMDMAQLDEQADIDDILDFTGLDSSEIYVAIGELADFMGPNNGEFVTLLTNLWDNLPDYKQPKIQGKSVVVIKPCVNILGGCTATTFATSFPPEAVGGGFLSRLLLVYAEPSGVKVAWPSEPDAMLAARLIHTLNDIKTHIQGAFSVTPEAKKLLGRMYREEVPVNDGRFVYYANRRYVHLLKIAMVLAACRVSMEINEEDALKANTILVNAERSMPKALGEFGKNKNSDVASKLLEILRGKAKPMNANELFKLVSSDVSRLAELSDIMRNLQDAGKVTVKTIGGKTGFVPNYEEVRAWSSDLLLDDYLFMGELS